MKVTTVETFFRSEVWRNRMVDGLWIEGDYRSRSKAAAVGLDLARYLHADHLLTYADHATRARDTRVARGDGETSSLAT